MNTNLSKSEKAIVAHIANGMSSRAIAAKHNVSVRTVEKHRSNIIKKLKLSKEANSLTRWALSNNLAQQEAQLITNP